MIQNTQISNDVTLSDEMIQFDTQAKNILSYACIEAWILKGVVKEFQNYSVQRICSILTGKKLKGIMLDGERKIQMINTRDTVEGQQDIELDAFFQITVPEVDARIFLNVELQKAPGIKRWLRRRGWYYVTRLTTRQSGIVFEKSHYEQIEKVYSIWIVGGKRKKSRIERYQLQNGPNALEVMELVIIYLGNPDDPDVSPIEQLLNTLFSATMSIEKKKKILHDKFFIAMHSDMERTVEDVCNMSQGIWEMGCADGRKIGRREGREEVMKEVAITHAKEGFSQEYIARLLKVSVGQIREWIHA